MGNNTQPTNESLIKKLLLKIQAGASAAWDFTMKRILPVGIAIGMGFTLASCNDNDIIVDSPIDSGYTGITTDSTTSDSELSTDTDITDPEKDKLSSYSSLIQGMLTDQDYRILLSNADNNPILLTSAYFDPHPYAFLEDQSHNVEKIKEGLLECNTQAFTKEEDPNALYIATYVENEGGYYSEYMLKFNLTEKEMEDYKTFHNKHFVQAVFLNDWISANKTVTIVSKMNVDIETHNGLAKTLVVNDKVLQNLDVWKRDLFLIFSSADKESRCFNVYAMEHIFEYNNMATSKKIADIPMRAWSNYSFDNDMIYFSSYYRSDFEVLDITDVDSARIYYNQTTALNSSYNNTIKDALD